MSPNPREHHVNRTFMDRSAGFPRKYPPPTKHVLEAASDMAARSTDDAPTIRSGAFRYPDGRTTMTMTTEPTTSTRQRWSMTNGALTALRADAARLAEDADRIGGYVTAHMAGEPDAPSLVPNIEGQRLIRQLMSVRSALAAASVEVDEAVVVIGRQVTLESSDGSRSRYALVIPGDGDPAKGRISAESPLGRAIYGRQAGDIVQVNAPDGAWTATVISVE